MARTSARTGACWMLHYMRHDRGRILDYSGQDSGTGYRAPAPSLYLKRYLAWFLRHAWPGPGPKPCLQAWVCFSTDYGAGQG